MTIGICKFCGKEKELIKSHIIPKALYNLKINGPVIRVDVENKCLDRNTRQQNGAKEPLMCSECDNTIGKLDGYTNKVLNGAVPKLNTIKFIESCRCTSLTSDKFDIDKLRRFFISVLWRMSVASNPIPLGKYRDIALGILKGETPDDYDLFLPLIYRRITGENVDEMTVLLRCKYLGKTSYTFRFPGYEVVIIVNTKNSKSKEMMEIHKKQFNKNEVLIVDITKNTPLDHKLARLLFDCRDNTPGFKRPKQ